ncbi:MgtC/SapB family protein [Pseudooceanicola sp. HF7]|uniref:MgtC/SapB family protein n=1 Tax=Pseudooceanicola sp. HF7 TaxID=2721560 RepID=UPI00142F99EF|nr:MgtC/SapB family protein [Pseudooceanicola sp. HF7]NIZ10990.1 MgtC/SapB family protein [Pseudooceanicola sp. HF7]
MEEFLTVQLASPVAGFGWSTVILRLGAAIILGGVIGWEREYQRKSAGLRTHIMVALAACLFTLIMLGLLMDPLADDDSIRKDPIRVIEAVTAGVAFLAGGSIFTAEDKVQGVTTGAGLWLAGAVGLCCGMGNIALAALASLLAVVVLYLLKVGIAARNG